MLTFFALLFCHALLSMQLRGITRRRMLLLGSSATAMALTHYFSAGAIVGAMAYTMIYLKGDVRKKAVIAISAGLFLALLVWGPVFWNTRTGLDAFPNFSMVSGNRFPWIVRGIITAPAQLFLDASANWSWQSSIPLALLAYAAPPLLARKSPEMLLWWLWILGAVGLLLAIDIVRGTTLVTVIRYLFITSPIIYIILATLLPDSWLGKLISCSALACAMIYGIDRFQIGHADTGLEEFSPSGRSIGRPTRCDCLCWYLRFRTRMWLFCPIALYAFMDSVGDILDGSPRRCRAAGARGSAARLDHRARSQVGDGEVFSRLVIS